MFSRGEDPLPQALHALTEYDMAAVDRVATAKDSAGLYALLETEPETFTAPLLLGRLVYASPLGHCIAATLAPDGSAGEATRAHRRAELSAYALHYAEWNSNRHENYLLSRYATAHLVMTLFVSAVLNAGGLDDLLLQEHRLTADIEDLPEKISDMREAAAIMLSGYIEVVRENEGIAAGFQALEARLQPVLALTGRRVPGQPSDWRKLQAVFFNFSFSSFNEKDIFRGGAGAGSGRLVGILSEGRWADRIYDGYWAAWRCRIQV